MRRFLGFFVFFVVALYGVDEVRVVPVEQTPESNTVVTKIVFPRPYENKRKTPVNVQLRVEGFPLGVITQNDRAKQIYDDPEGQAIHVIVDNEPYLIYNQSFEDSFDENREFYDKIVSFHIPFTLKPGMHVLRVFPARSYGESLKGKGPFSAEIFYFQDRNKSDDLNIDLQKPYLTYNEPQGRYPSGNGDPILLDFLLSNCQLSQDGYKVRLTVDNEVIATLIKYTPYLLYGLSPGKHTVKLELLDKENKIVPGFFNVTQREVEIDNNLSDAS